MKKKLVTLIISAFALGAHAQITFQKTYGRANSDEGYSVKQTTDGGYIISGFGADSGNVYLIKTDSTGDTLWTKTYGAGSGNSVQQTTDGGYIIAGSGGTNSGPAGYLIKTNNYGDTLWTKGIDGAWDATSIRQTSDGGYIVAGNYRVGYLNYTIYLTKTDSTGTTLWTEKISTDPYQKLGYPDVQQTTDGGYIVLGDFYFGAGCLVKTDALGNVLWSKIYNVYGLSSVQLTDDNGYIITGGTSASTQDIVLIKTDSSGSVVWSKNYDGTGDDYGISVQQTADGGYVIAGTNGLYGISLVKTDGSGNLLWSKTYGDTTGGDAVSSVQQTADGGYAIAGYTASFGAGYDDIYLIKTDSLGNSGCNEGNPAITTTSPFIPSTVLPLSVTILDSTDIPLITTIGGGGVVTTLCITTGTDEILGNAPDNSISIFPNPLTSFSILQLSAQVKNADVVIYDILGKEIIRKQLAGNKMEIERGSLDSGVYFVKVRNNDRQYIKKLVVE